MDKKIKGSQRLSLAKLQAWEKLGYGMFIHYGMSTYTGTELDGGSNPSTLYAPDKLDVDQWVSVARDAGMKYAVLTTKHVAGHCLWPTKLNDYHVGTSGNKTDVVEAFVKACEKRGVLPGFYYCSWDNHNVFGSNTPTRTANWQRAQRDYLLMVQMAFTTRAYMEFQSSQIEELLTQYGTIAEVWIDIPSVLPRFYRQELYDQIAGLQQSTATLATQLDILREKVDARDDLTVQERELLDAVIHGIDNLLASAHCTVASGLMVADGGMR